MITPRLNLYLLVIMTVIGLLSSPSKSLRFELESGHTKCISEDIKSNSMTVGKYSIVNPHDSQPLPESHKLTVRVRYWKRPMISLLDFFFLAILKFVICVFLRWHRVMGIVITIQSVWNQGSLLSRRRKQGITWRVFGRRIISQLWPCLLILIGRLVWLLRIGLMLPRKALWM